MRLWMSSEVWREVADAEHQARQAIVHVVNDRIDAVDYGSGVVEWAYLSMITPPGIGYEKERKWYHRVRRVLEFRLKIDYAQFAGADPQGCQRLMIASMRRSLQLAGEMRIPDCDVARLRKDFDALASERDWLTPV